MIEVEYENIFREALRNGINLFVGSGFARLAQDARKRPLPTGAELLQELLVEFEKPELSSLTLPQLCAILEASRRAEFYAYLRLRLTVQEFDPRYSPLDALQIRTLFTTNIDDLLFKIFAPSRRRYLNDLILRGPTFSDREAIDLVTLHGCILHEDEPLTFSTLDLAASFSQDPDKWHVLTHRLQQYPTLFWGYSLADAGVLEALNPMTVRGREHADKWIMLPSRDRAISEYFEALGFHIIVGDTAGMLDYIQDWSAQTGPKPAPLNVRDTKKLFPDEAVPASQGLPVRPLQEFYLGAPPTWHDIYSGRLHKTKHYQAIVDSIMSRKHTLVLGLPACGKSTLMMQVAAGIEYKGHKLVTGSLSVEKAELILNKLAGDPALVFVDDFAADLEAFDVLFKATNVQLVGFDRDYNYDIGSHRISIDPTRGRILSVTELGDADVQAIWGKIPPELRVEGLRRPSMSGDAKPSLYEVLHENINRPSLSIRFTSMLERLDREEQLLHDLLLMTCYVHACRVPVSFDTASAFLRGDVSSYEEIGTLVDRLGLMVTEYVGAMIDSDQDYYMARSGAIAEAIIEQSHKEAFRRVLRRFHKQVSPLRICRYDIFRRSAFDEKYARKAFSNWREGLEFYRDVSRLDTSPYLRQQAALYLAHQGTKTKDPAVFDEAFRWIDEALDLSQNKIFSIRNSHAVILFEANIGKQETGKIVRTTLDSSMRILERCYRSDKRKTYHAIKYAEQALRYYERFSDDKAREYLDTADHWLEDCERDAPWNYNVKKVHRNVRACLRDASRKSN